MRRLVATTTVTLGLVVSSLAGPALFAGAEASPAPGAAAAASRVDAQASSPRALPKRNLHDKVVKKRGKLYFRGHVSPRRGPVIVQKRLCQKCAWKRFRKVAVHGPRANWSVRIYSPSRGSWYWRAYVGPGGGYGLSRSGIWRTYRL